MLNRLKSLAALGLLWTVSSYAPAEEARVPADITALSPFGIGSCHTNNRTKESHQSWMPQMVEIGIASHRTPATGWGAVEPEEGKFVWDNLDKQMQYLIDQKIEFGAILAGNPKWNTKDKPGYLPVNNLAGWSKYAGEVAKHVKGKINHFEIWNEPPNFTGKDQTPADYAKIVVAAYDAVKAVDPTLKVGLAAKSVHVNYLEQVIKAGAMDHFDYITLHPYELLDGVAGNIGTEPVYMNIVKTVRKMLAAQNPEKVNVPIIFTELGCDARKGQDVQAHALIKAYTMGIAQGITCIQWFEGRDGDSGPMGLLDGKGNPRTVYHAYANMIKHFGKHPKYLGYVLLNRRDYGFVFEGAKGTVLCTWAPKGAPDPVEFGQSVKIVDPLKGNETSADKYDLTVAPIFVLGVPDALVKQAKENKDKPFPWGGDYTDAKSVSITMGEKNTEKGLHTHSGANLAAAVVLYGGGARAGNVPGGNVFIVDPNFLTYSTVPLEISVVVRRNEKGDPAKLTLEYESTMGYKKLTPFEIPEAKEWHTAKWKIEDAQFVNMWNFSFRYNSGSYFVQSVTVTKLEK